MFLMYTESDIGGRPQLMPIVCVGILDYKGTLQIFSEDMILEKADSVYAVLKINGYLFQRFGIINNIINFHS